LNNLKNFVEQKTRFHRKRVFFVVDDYPSFEDFCLQQKQQKNKNEKNFFLTYNATTLQHKYKYVILSYLYFIIMVFLL